MKDMLTNWLITAKKVVLAIMHILGTLVAGLLLVLLQPTVFLSILIVMTFVALDAKAADTEVILGGWSHHWTSENVTNESHDAIGVKYNGYMGVYFQNSFDQDSVMFGKVFEHPFNKYLTGSILLGVVHGYDQCYRKNADPDASKVLVCPAVVPAITFHTGTPVDIQLSQMGDATVITAVVPLP